MLTQLEALKAMGIEVWVLRREEKEIVEKLSNKDNFENEPALVGEPKEITHSVRFYERSKTPLEILSTCLLYTSDAADE